MQRTCSFANWTFFRYSLQSAAFSLLCPQIAHLDIYIALLPLRKSPHIVSHCFKNVIDASQEAKSLGIPEYALPQLSAEPTLDEARKAQKKVESIMASFLSANI